MACQPPLPPPPGYLSVLLGMMSGAEPPVPPPAPGYLSTMEGWSVSYMSFIERLFDTSAMHEAAGLGWKKHDRAQVVDSATVVVDSHDHALIWMTLLTCFLIVVSSLFFFRCKAPRPSISALTSLGIALVLGAVYEQIGLCVVCCLLGLFAGQRSTAVHGAVGDPNAAPAKSEPADKADTADTADQETPPSPHPPHCTPRPLSPLTPRRQGSALLIYGLRHDVMSASDCLTKAMEKLEDALRKNEPHRSLRSLYLQPISEVLMPPAPDRNWQGEWVQMALEQNRWLRDQGVPIRDDMLTEAGILQRDSIEVVQTKFQEDIDDRVAHGFTLEEAQAFTVLVQRRRVLALSLRESSGRYCASIYKLLEVLYAQVERVQTDQRAPGGGDIPKCYRNVYGKGGLVHDEPRWGELFDAAKKGAKYDRNGFCGVTSSAVIEGWTKKECFVPEGFRHCFKDRETGPGEYKYCDAAECAGPIVCFKSRGRGERDELMHAGIRTDSQRICFPPHTLFRLREIKEPGTWCAEVDGVDVRPEQWLLVVTATYRPPPSVTSRFPVAVVGRSPSAVVGRSPSGSVGKLVGSKATLRYGDRESYVAGIEDITANPVLTIEQEFCREGFEFTDYAGVLYRLQDEYEYVVGTAKRKEDCTPGIRDEQHDGWTLDEFLSVANKRIASRRTPTSERPEGHAYLSEEEVIAVRLYTGPSYIVINDFLRQIGTLNGTLRRALATHPAHTFAATVGHLCSAIRKLSAAATADEAQRTLYRGVRGELDRSFFSRDRLGMVVATDATFMSTSTERATPLQYMSAEKNVMWRLRANPETDDGYHYGADVSILSQFARENEVLFPPCTMLAVELPSEGAPEMIDRIMELEAVPSYI